MSPIRTKPEEERQESLNSAVSEKDANGREDKPSKEEEDDVLPKESPVLEWIRTFWRCSTALIIMMWLYLPPNTPSAISCLSQGSEMTFVGILTSCQESTCSGWFQTHSPLPPNLGLIAVTQMAIGTSVLWMWLALMSLVALFPVEAKEEGAKRKQPKVLSWKFVKGCIRTLSRTLRKLVIYGQAMGLLSVVIVSLAVFFTVVMQVAMEDTGETLGSGTYLCCGPLILLSSQGLSPGPKEIELKKRGLRWLYRTCFCPVLLPVKLLGSCFSNRSKRGHKSSRADDTGPSV